MTVKTEMAWNFIYSRFLSSLPHNFRLTQMYPSVFSTPEKGIKARQIPSPPLSVEVYYMEKNYIIYNMNKCYQLSSMHTANCSLRNVLHFNIFANSVTLFWPESCTSHLMRNTFILMNIM